jgi:AcrR family transcriptional regulator
MSRSEQRIQDAALRLFAERGVTQVSVSELAEAAGVARGTIYNNFENVDSLFEDVATELTSEMDARISASTLRATDPAQRIADGMRFFVRRAHEEPLWGRFLVRFAPSTPTLIGLLQSAPMGDVRLGVQLGQFSIREDQIPAAVAMMSASVLAAMSLVLEGHRTWRDAGADAAELFLRALGLEPDAARAIATSELPELRPGE